MSLDKLVTVIIPTYNRKSSILRAVYSVLKQSHTLIQLIVIDDCSNDKTIETLASIIDHRVTIIKNKSRKGAAISRNIGIEASTGKYIAFLDSDDEWEYNYLEERIKFITLHKVHVIYGSMILIQQNKHHYYKSRDLKKNESMANYLLSGRLRAVTSSIFVDQIVTSVLQFNNVPIHQDYEFMIQASRKFKLKCDSRFLGKYYHTSTSISLNINKASLDFIEKYNDEINTFNFAFFLLRKSWFFYEQKNLLLISHAKLLINKKSNESNIFSFIILWIIKKNMQKLSYTLKAILG